MEHPHLPAAVPPAVPTAALEELVRSAFPGATFDATPMQGGASTRRYFRLELRGGPVARAVAMFVPAGGKAEEIDKAAASRRWPFLEVRDLLASRGIDVPAVYADASERGWLLLEDLGDDTLAVVLLRAPALKPALYTLAVTDLARAQATLAELPEPCVVRTRAFDEDLLFWEVEHFREWGLEARGKPLSSTDRETFDVIARRLAARIAAFPRVFVHRDYQSRNLMVRDAAGDPRFVWIDFQDALLGPAVYDLVALLNDSYQEFTSEFVAARLDDYAAARGLPEAERDALPRQFDLVTVQRKLKDAGRFVFIERTKQNAAFLRYVVPTVKKARAALARLADDPDMAELARLLDRTRAAEG